jgi:hypothetical protein
MTKPRDVHIEEVFTQWYPRKATLVFRKLFVHVRQKVALSPITRTTPAKGKKQNFVLKHIQGR